MSQTKDALMQASQALVAAANHIDAIETAHQTQINDLEYRVEKNEKFMRSLKELLNDYYNQY